MEMDQSRYVGCFASESSFLGKVYFFFSQDVITTFYYQNLSLFCNLFLLCPYLIYSTITFPPSLPHPTLHSRSHTLLCTHTPLTHTLLCTHTPLPHCTHTPYSTLTLHCHTPPTHPTLHSHSTATLHSHTLLYTHTPLSPPHPTLYSQIAFMMEGPLVPITIQLFITLRPQVREIKWERDCVGYRDLLEIEKFDII